MSMDGFITDAEGGHAWIPEDESIDFDAFLSGIDAVVMGRRTFDEAMSHEGGLDWLGERHIYVASRTRETLDHPRARLLVGDVEKAVRALLEQPGGDIWLFGGADLCGTLLSAGLVDRIEVAVAPVLLGEGLPLVSGGPRLTQMRFHSSEAFESGFLLVKYDVLR